MESLIRLLTTHFTRYPLMQVQDLYKLLHQATLGSEHAVLDESSAQKRLETEMASMGEGLDEPLLDPISPDGSIARLHLRPCLQAGIDPQAILSAFLRTAQEWHGSYETLQEYGPMVAQLAEDENWHISRQEMVTFFATMEKEGFPPWHHSQIFSATYHPAYRVVSTEIWRQYESLHLSPRPDHL
jgi:hypothetical protein